ncbi:hypothetical protein D3C72_1069830 [compost metagenome]
MLLHRLYQGEDRGVSPLNLNLLKKGFSPRVQIRKMKSPQQQTRRQVNSIKMMLVRVIRYDDVSLWERLR